MIDFEWRPVYRYAAFAVGLYVLGSTLWTSTYAWMRLRGKRKPLMMISKHNATDEHARSFGRDFEQLRTQGDLVADEVIDWLHSDCGDAKQLKTKFPELDTWSLVQEGAKMGFLPCVRFVSEVNRLPKVDYALAREGQRTFRRNFLPCCISLLVSLTMSYLGEKGSQVLICTGRLKSDTQKRLDETAHMILTLNYSNGLLPGSDAHRVLIQVRLLHAQVRSWIGRAVRWNPENGVPINQQDMLGTVTLFSSVIMDGCESLGAHITSHDRMATTELWKLAGFYLGVREDILPTSYDDEIRIREYIAATQVTSNRKGARLVKNLFDGIPNSGIHRHFVNHMSPTLSEFVNLEPGDVISRIPMEGAMYAIWTISHLNRFLPVLSFVTEKGSYWILRVQSRLRGKNVFAPHRFEFRTMSHPKIKISEDVTSATA